MAKKTKTPIHTLLITQAATLDITDFILTLPLDVLLTEALDVARFAQRYWHAQVDPKTGLVLRPGLELAGDRFLPAAITEEIIALHELVQTAQTAHALAVGRPDKTVQRAEHALAELASALEWICDDGKDPELADKLAAIIESHRNDPETQDALASELADYVGLATQLQQPLSAIAIFDLGLIAEADKLVLTLRERSAMRARGVRCSEAAMCMQRRNQFCALLVERITRVRAAARYVFRHHKQLISQVTSAYQRVRRAASRRRAAQNATTPIPPPTTATGTRTRAIRTPSPRSH